MLRDVTADGLVARLNTGDDRPVVLLLHTPTCGTCQVARRMLTIALRALADDALDAIALDLNQAPDLAQAWEVTSVPCILYWRGGEVRDRMYAVQSVDHLWRWLGQHAAK